jgi:hypothetical protein
LEEENERAQEPSYVLTARMGHLLSQVPSLYR